MKWRYLKMFFKTKITFFLSILFSWPLLAAEITSVNQALLEISSTYNDSKLGPQKMRGTGFAVQLEHDGQERLFVITNSHVSQGDLSPRSIIEVNGKEHQVLGRYSDNGVSDIELIEIESGTFEPTFVRRSQGSGFDETGLTRILPDAFWLHERFNPEPFNTLLWQEDDLKNNELVSAARREYVNPSRRMGTLLLVVPPSRQGQVIHHRPELIKTDFGSNSGQNNSFRRALYSLEFSFPTLIVGGVSGTPLVSYVSSRGNAALVKRGVMLRCVAKSFDRFSLRSQCTPAKRLAELMDQYLNETKSPSPFVWRSEQGITHRIIEGFFKELATFRPAGSGSSGDGGSGTSGDGNDNPIDLSSVAAGAKINGKNVLGLRIDSVLEYADDIHFENLAEQPWNLFADILGLEVLLKKLGGLGGFKKAIHQKKVELLDRKDILRFYWQHRRKVFAGPYLLQENADFQYMATEDERVFLRQKEDYGLTFYILQHKGLVEGKEIEYPARRIDILNNGQVLKMCQPVESPSFPFVSIYEKDMPQAYLDLRTLLFDNVYFERMRNHVQAQVFYAQTEELYERYLLPRRGSFIEDIADCMSKK